jgi:hypothetical protein
MLVRVVASIIERQLAVRSSWSADEFQAVFRSELSKSLQRNALTTFNCTRAEVFDNHRLHPASACVRFLGDCNWAGYSEYEFVKFTLGNTNCLSLGRGIKPANNFGLAVKVEHHFDLPHMSEIYV